MCGIAGFVGEPRHMSHAAEIANGMAAALAHRGPDSSGVWVDPESGVCLAHRRLAVLDLSEAGHQPMISSGGRYVITFNGEIYNHAELRRQLSPPPIWLGHSDTETLLACLDAWGLEGTLSRCIGMFAFGLWDRAERTLSLVRDRLGEKPLYYGWQGGVLLFGSDLAALRRHPAFEGDIDRAALAAYLDCGYYAAPTTAYRGIHKLPAGHYATVMRPDLGRPKCRVTVTSYWSARDIARHGDAVPPIDSIELATDHLDTLVRQAVAGQMVADVPVGAFLSGGIDSSLVVSMMQAQTTRRVQTFTVGFGEREFDESRHAARVAAHLGTEHHEMIVTSDDALRLVPGLAEVYSEPLADSSQLPTIIVAKHARRHVTVALSGDGGDELFCGYSRYFLADSIWRVLGRLPPSLRGIARRAIALAPPARWNRILRQIAPILPRQFRRDLPGDDLHKGAAFLDARSALDVYRTLLSFSVDARVPLVLGEPAPLEHTRASAWWPDAFTAQAGLLDIETYLAEDILTKVDRASMSVALETRVPLLDHRIVEFAINLAPTLKVHGTRGKLPLRRVLARYVPDRLVERPKMGFSVPIAQWLRTSLRPWAEDLLDDSTLRRDGFLDPAMIRARWDEHLGGQRNWQYFLWSVLMFRSWQESIRNASNVP